MHKSVWFINNIVHSISIIISNKLSLVEVEVIPQLCTTCIYKIPFQIPQILTKVKGSLNGMPSYNPKNVFFLLNKWDTFYHGYLHHQEMLFEEIKLILRKSWRKVDDSSVFKISAEKVSKFYIIGLKNNPIYFLKIYHSNIINFKSSRLLILMIHS